VTTPYTDKFQAAKEKTVYSLLDEESQGFISSLAHQYRFTFQELREVSLASRELSMWREASLQTWWEPQEQICKLAGKQRKKHLLRLLSEHLSQLQAKPNDYPAEGLPAPERQPYRIVSGSSDKKIFGRCPVYSDDTVCCGLHTIDAVTGCAMGCSYCTIQTFYGEDVVVDQDLAAKLNALKLDRDRFYHLGTGQSSDSLLWGNRSGNLSKLCNFARQYPKALLEFKTKSNNVRFFLENPVPKNVVCSWSLNTPTVVTNEEHYTAAPGERLEAARKVADRGIPVAFHFHPMIYHRGWEDEYTHLVKTVLEGFSPEEVLFVSFGTVTFIKPVLREIRRRGTTTKISQMAMVKDPHGKLTYPDHIKEAMYRHIYKAFAPWADKVFMYLCMERAHFWHTTFGYCYPDSQAFEAAFADVVKAKL
jgi:DNA repair photolyase